MKSYTLNVLIFLHRTMLQGIAIPLSRKLFLEVGEGDDDG
jgi:hypothetical protein